MVAGKVDVEDLSAPSADDDRASLSAEELGAQDDALAEAATLESEVAVPSGTGAAETVAAKLFRDELALLDEMAAIARANRFAPDARVKKLAEWIRHELPEYSRLIVFTEYEDTKAYLVDQLKAIFPKGCEERIESFSG